MRDTRRRSHSAPYGLVWAAGGAALVLLMLQVLFGFDLGPVAAAVPAADLAITLLYLSAARRARAWMVLGGRGPLAITADQIIATAFAALSIARIVAGAAHLGGLPGMFAGSALGKAAIAVLAVSLQGRLRARDCGSKVRPVTMSPPATIAISFLLAILTGALLLALPEASATGQSIGALDALFTATSATCVTGLIVKDTPNDHSGFGLIVILLLIQLGGLGIMTLAGMFGAVRGQK